MKLLPFHEELLCTPVQVALLRSMGDTCGWHVEGKRTVAAAGTLKDN